MPHSPHIALYSQCGFGNFGNDATLELVLNHLRRQLPNAHFTCVVRHPEAVSQQLDAPAIGYYPEPRFPRRDEPSLLTALRRAANEICRVASAFNFLRTVDYMVIAGGGRFDDFNSLATEQPYRLWLWTKLARLLGARVELVAIGAGPVDFKLSKWFYRGVARAVTRRSFRDEESARYVTDTLGIDTRGDEVTADLVFAFPTPINVSPPKTPVRTVGVGVMEYNNRRGTKDGPDDQYGAYVTNLTKFCLGLLARGLNVKILIGETCDWSAACDLHARLTEAAPDKADQIELCTAKTLRDVLGAMAKCDAVAATRFHNVVGALRLGRPVLSLGYASKNQRVMEEFGLGGYCQTIETCDPERLLAQFDDLCAHAATLAPRVRARATTLRWEMETVLDQLTQRVRDAVSRTAEVEVETVRPAPPRRARVRAQ